MLPPQKFVTDGAGVDEDQISLGRIGSGSIAHFHRHTTEPLGVGFILLTAKGLDVNVQISAPPRRSGPFAYIRVAPESLRERWFSVDS